MMSERDAAIVAAAEWFGETWAELAMSLVDDYGCTMTCGEAEALTALFRALGLVRLAETVMAQHAAEDDEGDEHYRAE